MKSILITNKKLSGEFIERFWKKVDIRGENDCWEWQACTQTRGYGSVGLGNGKTGLAHRVAYKIAKGRIPAGLCVMHTCDNKLCCNPKHLKTGTIAENNRDAVRKGRNAKGERNGNSKLSISKVVKLRKQWVSGKFSAKELAKLYRISEQQARSVGKGEYWELPVAE